MNGSSPVGKGGNAEFTAVVSGANSPSQSVTWSITTVGVAAGTKIDSNGKLTVAATESKTLLTIKAVSQLDASQFGVKEVEVKAISKSNVIAKVTFSGTLTVDSTLTATALDSANAIVLGATFQWLRSDSAAGIGTPAEIAGATKASYTLVAADLHKYITVRANSTETGSSATAASRGPVQVAGENKSLTITGIQGLAAGQIYTFSLLDKLAEDAKIVAMGVKIVNAPAASDTLTVPLFASDTVMDETPEPWTGTGAYYLVLTVSAVNSDDADDADDAAVYFYTGNTSGIPGMPAKITIANADTSVAFTGFILMPADDDGEDDTEPLIL